MGEFIQRNHAVGDLHLGMLPSRIIVLREQSNQPAAIGDRQGRDSRIVADFHSLGNRSIGTEGDRIFDETVLEAFDLAHLVGLLLYGHVVVNHRRKALKGNGDG
jgi:hypothetical protein